jgi:hypothetical protein
LDALLWGVARVVVSILVIYWIYTIQARMGEVLNELREIKAAMRRQ